MLAFSNDYYGLIFRATQSVELFCAYDFVVDLVNFFDTTVDYIILGEEIKKERNYDFLIREIDDTIEQLLASKENLLKEKNEKKK